MEKYFLWNIFLLTFHLVILKNVHGSKTKDANTFQNVQKSNEQQLQPTNLDQLSENSAGVVILYSKSSAILGQHGDITNSISNHKPEDNTNIHTHGGPKPECAHEKSYCLFDKNYPMDQVLEIVDTYHEDVHHTYLELNHYVLQDYIAHDNSTHEFRHKGNFVCESDVVYIRPGWAKNVKNEWVTVINTEKYPQSVRVETCRYEGKKCEYLPPCYKSFCVQRYSYVKLLCVDPFNPHHRPVIDVFQIPSACSCFVENFVYY